MLTSSLNVIGEKRSKQHTHNKIPENKQKNPKPYPQPSQALPAKPSLTRLRVNSHLGPGQLRGLTGHLMGSNPARWGALPAPPTPPPRGPAETGTPRLTRTGPVTAVTGQPAPRCRTHAPLTASTLAALRNRTQRAGRPAPTARLVRRSQERTAKSPLQSNVDGYFWQVGSFQLHS